MKDWDVAVKEVEEIQEKLGVSFGEAFALWYNEGLWKLD